MDKRLVIFVVIIIFCILSIGAGVYQQFFYKYSDKDKLMLGKTETIVTEEKEEKVKDDFNNLFNNNVLYLTDAINSNAVRKDRNKDFIYTVNQYSKNVTGKYEMNINLPCINVDSKTANEINTNIEETFLPKANSILTTNVTTYTIYNIDYAGFITDDIASLVIRATLKEGNNPQRVMIMTYNYNLATGNIVTLKDILDIKKITKETLQNKINKEITEISRKSADFQNLGYSVYTRNPNDKMYNVDNKETQYFLGPDGYGYVLYAYGNKNNTSEVDVILF